MNHVHIRTLGFLCTLLAVLASGCHQFDLFRRESAKLPEATAEHPVVEALCLWEAADGTGLDGLPCRGFAGQILFFAAGHAAPVRANGHIRIYVFDDQGDYEEQQRPIHQFDFDGAAFQKFLADTNVGAAYQIFVPYTRKGNHRATCSLRVRLTPEHGSPVYSKMASIILPGTVARRPDEPIGSQTPASGILPASYEVAAAPSRPAAPSNPGITLPQAAPSAAAEKDLLRARLKEITRQPPAVAPSAGETPAGETSPQVPPGPPARFQRAE